MHLIKVDAISSTNSLAREWWKDNHPEELICFWAREQFEGRGQRGTQWTSEAGSNLTFSILVPAPRISMSHQFVLSALVALQLARGLRKMDIPRMAVKWPNDIMSANKKLGGILIENIVSNGKISASIVGIGLNVNQEDFSNLPSASSLKIVSGRRFDLQDLLESLLLDLEPALEELSDAQASTVMESYKKLLFRKDVASTFELPDKRLFQGIIRDVALDGKLIVQIHNDQLQHFDIKQVRLRF